MNSMNAMNIVFLGVSISFNVMMILKLYPIYDSDWYRCEKTLEVVCPWCIKDIEKMVWKLRNTGEKVAD